ncbi:SEC-C metal-binding domain-containing protein [Bradyrhizobium japonicum]
MTAKFNRPCACGSGKKYKDCHYGKEDRAALSGWADVSILDRNRLLIRAAQSIFGFPHRRTWADFKRDIADEEIREFFNVHGSMWVRKLTGLASCQSRVTENSAACIWAMFVLT